PPSAISIGLSSQCAFLMDKRDAFNTPIANEELFGGGRSNHSGSSGISTIGCRAPLANATVFRPAINGTPVAGAFRRPHAPVDLRPPLHRSSIHAGTPTGLSSIFQFRSLPLSNRVTADAAPRLEKSGRARAVIPDRGQPSDPGSAAGCMRSTHLQSA